MAICCVPRCLLNEETSVHIHKVVHVSGIVDPIVDPEISEQPARGQCEDGGKDAEVAASAGEDGCHFG